MTTEIINASEFPKQYIPKYEVLHRAVRRLPQLQPGQAIRISVADMDVRKIAGKAHDYAAAQSLVIQTATRDGFVYLRRAERIPLEVVTAPTGLMWKRKGERKGVA